MRRWMLLVVCVLSVVGVCEGLAQADDYGNEPSAFEATLLPSGNVELQGQIEIIGDVDCFMFEAQTQTTYTLELATRDDGLDPLLVLFDRNGRTVLAVDDNGGGGHDAKIEFTPTFAGLYFVCARNARATQGSGAYTLTLDSEPATTASSLPQSEPPTSEDNNETTTPPTNQTPPPPEQTTPPTPPEQTSPPSSVPSGEVLKEGRVLLLGGDDDQSIKNVQDYLTATGAFTAVDAINAAERTPSAAELNRYEAVLTWADSGFKDADALGDLLADYADRGGGVVVAAVSFDIPDPFDPDTLGGRFLSGNYYVIQPDADNVGNDRRVLGNVNNASHPVMQGVNKIDGGPSSLHSPTASLTPGGTVLASWDNGDVLVAVKSLERSNRVDVNLFPPSSLLDPDLWPFTQDNDVPRLMVNALYWVAGRQAPFSQTPRGGPALLELGTTSLNFSGRIGQPAPANQSITVRNGGGQPLSWSASVDVSWLSLSPLQGELQPGESQAILVAVDVTTLAAGSHNATVTITAPGADNGVLRVPVSLILEPVTANTPAPPTASGSGRVIRVPQDVSLLSNAIADAQSGDTIQIAAGSYTNVALTIDKPLTLRGEAGVILRGNGRDPVIAVQQTAGTVTLDALNLNSGGDGLLLSDGARVVLTNNTILDNLGWGVRSLGAISVLATGNTIASNRSGGITIDIAGAGNTNSQVFMSDNIIRDNVGCGIHVASDEPGIQVSGSGNRIQDNGFDLCDNGNKLPQDFVVSQSPENDPASEAQKFDSDGDGVPDADDFCPLTPGKKDNNGCP